MHNLLLIYFDCQYLGFVTKREVRQPNHCAASRREIFLRRKVVPLFKWTDVDNAYKQIFLLDSIYRCFELLFSVKKKGRIWSNFLGTVYIDLRFSRYALWGDLRYQCSIHMTLRHIMRAWNSHQITILYLNSLRLRSNERRRDGPT